MPDLGEYEWSVQPFSEPLDIEVERSGEDWLHKMSLYLSRHYGMTGYQARTDQPPFVGTTIHPQGCDLRSILWLAMSPSGGLLPLILGIEEQRDQVDPWIEAMRWARQQIGVWDHFPWWAVISEDPESSPKAYRLALTETARFGDMEIEPANVYHERREIPLSLGAYGPDSTQLVRVHGSSRGYDGWAALKSAARELKVLCGLLSVASRHSWTLRLSPQPIMDADFDISAVKLPTAWKYDSADTEYIDPPLKAFTVPAWAINAWPILAEKPWLTRLVIAFQEGLLLARQHESFAALAFVAIIEEIGNRGQKPARCPSCKQVTGSGVRFISSLSRVMPANEAEMLGKTFYAYRSKTAHTGALHGWEESFGISFVGGMLGGNPTEQFKRSVEMLQVAASRLLMVEMGAAEVPTTSLVRKVIQVTGVVHGSDMTSDHADEA